MCLEGTKLHRLRKVCCFHAFSGKQTKRHEVEASNMLVDSEHRQIPIHVCFCPLMINRLTQRLQWILASNIFHLMFGSVTLARNEMRLERNETHLMRNETRGGKLLLTVL